MKLTRDEQSSLYDLTISTGRADAATPRLVQLGLAETGVGKFGRWVKITAKGRALANTFTREDQISMLAASGGHSDDPSQSVRKKTQPAPSSGDDAEATAMTSVAISPSPKPPARSAPIRRETQQLSPRSLTKPAPIAPSSSSPRSPYLRKLNANRS